MGDEPRRHDSLVSVVIPAYNAAATIGEQLAALGSQCDAGPFEVVIADNGSTDDTRRVAADRAAAGPEVRVVDAASKPGPAHARNAGARAARGDLILFCDADDVASPGWVRAMREAWVAGADLVGGSLDPWSLNTPEVVAWRGAIQQAELPVGYRFLPYAVSANVAVDAEVFAVLGGFDESFPSAAGEDCDLCFRAQLLGYELTFAADAVMAYRHRPDLRGAIRQARGYGRSSAVLYRRYRSWGFYRPPLRRQVRKVRRHLRQAPRLLEGPGSRGKWLWQLTFLVARVEGAVVHRVAYW